MSDVQKHLKPTDYIKTDINILLLGESGVGKSTFINSFANYLQYTDLNAAIQASKVFCLIPTRFTIPDDNFVDQVVELGVDKNEDVELGNSSTQGARAYVFPIKDEKEEDRKIRIIDTPGIGDARGIKQDDVNFENVLEYISRFPEIHAICFLLKPNVAVINPYFKFCIMHLLSRLEKSAVNNILFVFTNARSTSFKPMETLPSLRRVLDEVKAKANVTIPCGKSNIFCLDNEGFKYLVAFKQGIKFGDHERRNYIGSWDASVKTCWTMLGYIAGDYQKQALIPHKTQNTLSVNEARRIIIDLSKPLADIADMIHDNIHVLDRHKALVLQNNLTIDNLQNNLYIPAINIAQKELKQPVTVCTALDCSERYTVLGITKYHYKQRCHNPCYLTNVAKEIIGSPELLNCASMSNKKCIKCKNNCDFSTHMHIMYETELSEERLEDQTVKTRIHTEEDKIRAQYEMIMKIHKRTKEFDTERDIISCSMAKFAHFLKENAIAAYNDAYSDYIDYLIDRENSLGRNKDADLIKRYKDMKKQYEQERNILEAVNKMPNEDLQITPDDVNKCIEDLYGLKHTGKQIKELHEKQQMGREKEQEHRMEYYHPSPINKPKSRNKNKALTTGELFEKLLKQDDVEKMRIVLKNATLKDVPTDTVDDKKQEIWHLVTNYQKSGNKVDKVNENKQKQRPPKMNNQQKSNQNQTNANTPPVPSLMGQNFIRPNQFANNQRPPNQFRPQPNHFHTPSNQFPPPQNQFQQNPQSMSPVGQFPYPNPNQYGNQNYPNQFDNQNQIGNLNPYQQQYHRPNQFPPNINQNHNLNSNQFPGTPSNNQYGGAGDGLYQNPQFDKFTNNLNPNVQNTGARPRTHPPNTKNYKGGDKDAATKHDSNQRGRGGRGRGRGQSKRQDNRTKASNSKENAGNDSPDESNDDVRVLKAIREVSKMSKNKEVTNEVEEMKKFLHEQQKLVQKSKTNTDESKKKSSLFVFYKHDQ